MPDSTLTTLALIKERLRIPNTDTTEDATLDVCRSAVEDAILLRTGFTFDGGSKTEQRIDVQLGVSQLMRFRPILPLDPSDVMKYVKLRARSMASNTLNDIIGELRDPFEGRIVALASELTPIFPPVGGQASWFRWRQMIWPVVEFTYNVDPLGSETNPVPNQLKLAALEWTLSIYALPSGGAVKQVTSERVSETYNTDAMPRVVDLLLARFNRGMAVQQF